MPKIIEGLEEKILDQARLVLLGDGYNALTMRAVSAGCKVAVGTIYNYFASKEVLCARVMLRDWQTALDGMQKDVSIAPDALSGLGGVFGRITAFWQIYARAWQQYADAGHAAPLRGPYHDALVSQLSGVIEPLLGRFCSPYPPALPGFIAESLLISAARGSDYFAQLEPIYKRLL